MIHLNRDPAFWNAVADHPSVVHAKHGHEVDAGALAMREDITPLASEHGGFMLRKLDVFGTIYELHTLYTPEGWGREVSNAKKAMCRRIFETASLIVTHETEHPQSRPPLSFGWKQAGETNSEIGRVRLWILTKEAWEQSPAGRRECRSLLQSLAH